MSCNGCRVLRKGCSDTCILRSSLQWIECPEAQGHATVFVAKFFGRAGMISFISAVSESQRPALFQSLLYEACGRTVNPVFGAVGLLWSGNWTVCQAAVESVLKGGSLQPPCFSTLAPKPIHPLACRSSTPAVISSNQCLKRPQSEELISETPTKHLKVSVHPMEPLLETSPSKDHSDCLLFKQSNQDLGYHEKNLVAEYEEATHMHNGQLHAPVLRRVRRHILHTILSAMEREPACEEQKTLREENHGAIELELTLNSHGSLADVGLWKMGSSALMRVSSPSSFSINSEGSVTTSETVEHSKSCLRTLSAQGHHQVEERKLLHLL